MEYLDHLAVVVFIMFIIVFFGITVLWVVHLPLTIAMQKLFLVVLIIFR